MHTVASVQARLGSTRLPGKVLFHLGDRRLLQWTIDRVTAADTVNRTVAALGDEHENDAVQAYCERANVDHLVGPEDDLVERHRIVADRTGCDVLVRVTADCPFVPSDEIDRVVTEHTGNDATYTTNKTDKMPIGTAVDVFDPGHLEKLKSLGATHPVKMVRSNPDQWDVVRTDNPSWYTVSDAHIAVDTPDDYWTLTDAVDAVGEQPMAVAEWVSER